jgi:lipid-A-disaccharide synthase
MPVTPVVPLAGPVAEAVREGTKSWPIPPLLVSDAEEKYDAFAASAVALTKSGTSTLELALAGVPMVVAYRVNPVSAMIARRLVKVKYASLLNLLMDRPVVPEFIQAACNPDRLGEALRSLLLQPGAAEEQVAGFAEPLRMLRAPDGSPSDAAAAAVLDLLCARSDTSRHG